MKLYVIVGAGIGGLYIATRLINKGVAPSNILLIEKRGIDQYTRPGHLIDEVFKLVHKITDIPITYSSARHFKELERAMYAYLSQHKVTILDEEFVGFLAQNLLQDKSVVTRKRDGSVGIYPAEYVFDCSGPKAVVVQAVNEYEQKIHYKQAFKTSLLVDTNPIPNHLTAHVEIHNSERIYDHLAYEKPLPPELEDVSSLQKIHYREQLLLLGWTYTAFPTFYLFSSYSKIKVCLYMEAPPNLGPEQHRSWIQLMLNIYSNGLIKDYAELKPSEKYATKPRNTRFTSTPYILNKSIHESDDLPTVIVAFDALKGFDYRTATGVISGITCSEYIFENMTVKDGRIQKIDCATVEIKTHQYIHHDYKNLLEKPLKGRQNAITQGLDLYREIYEQAATTSDELPMKDKQNYLLTAVELTYQALNMHSSDSALFETMEYKMEMLNKILSLCTLARPMSTDKDNQDLINTTLSKVIGQLCDAIDKFDLDEYPATEDLTGGIRTFFTSINDNFQKLKGTEEYQLIPDTALSKVQDIISKRTDSSSLIGWSPLSYNLFGLFPNIKRSAKEVTTFLSEEDRPGLRCCIS